MTTDKKGSLQDQLKAWKQSHSEEVPDQDLRRRRAEEDAERRAKAEAAEADAEAALSDEELFARAVHDVGDGSVAILEKYGRADDPPAPDQRERPLGRLKTPPAAKAPHKPSPAAEQNMFMDALEGVKPIKKG